MSAVFTLANNLAFNQRCEVRRMPIVYPLTQESDQFFGAAVGEQIGTRPWVRGPSGRKARVDGS